MPPPLPARPARSESAASEPFCPVCDAHAWTEIERHSRSPVGSGTRLSCQMCGAHRIVASDPATGAGEAERAWIEFVDPSADARRGPGDPRSN